VKGSHMRGDYEEFKCGIGSMTLGEDMTLRF